MKKAVFKVVTWNNLQGQFRTIGEPFMQYEQAEKFITMEYNGTEPLQIHKEWVTPTTWSDQQQCDLPGSEL